MTHKQFKGWGKKLDDTEHSLRILSQLGIKGNFLNLRKTSSKILQQIILIVKG